MLRLWKKKSPYMVIRMLEVRRGFQGSFSAKLGVDEFDPKQIAPTIAPPPLVNRKLMKAPSRFLVKTKR